MKVFISQPMAKRSQGQITQERQIVIDELRAQNKGVEILDTYFTDFDGNAVQFLGKSIMMLGEADIAVFLPGWAEARGCRIEEAIAQAYNIKRVYM